MHQSSAVDTPPAPSRARGVENAVFWLTGLVALVFLLGHLRGWVHNYPTDFRAFYSAGRVAAAHRDPYRLEPLLSEERSLVTPGNPLPVVDPVPLPPYDIALFRLFAVLPPRAAIVAFAALTLAAAGGIVYALRRMTGYPIPALFAAVSFGVLYSGTPFGQLAPFGVCAVALATMYARRGGYVPAALWALVALIQPQYGGPACIGLLLFAPRARPTLVVGGAAVLASCFAFGPALVREYPGVLSAQAAAELAFPDQYSLTWLLHAFGATARAATSLGSLSTLALLVGALVVAWRDPDRDRTGSAVLLPATFVVLGGSYVHLYQITIALLPILVYLRAPRFAFWSALAMALLVLPFDDTALRDPRLFRSTMVAAVAATAVAVAAMAYLMVDGPRRRRLSLSLGATSVAVAIFVGLAAIAPETALPTMHLALPYLPDDLPSHQWKIFSDWRGENYGSVPYLALMKAPRWIATSLMIGLVAATLLRRRDPLARATVPVVSGTVPAPAASPVGSVASP